VAVNAATLEISARRLCPLCLKFLRCSRARWRSFWLDFSCFVLCIKAKNEVGFGATPRQKKSNPFPPGDENHPQSFLYRKISSNFITHLPPMIQTLITSETRIKLLMKFFLNSRTQAHLRGLETEFGESSNAIRLELNRFEEAGLLNSAREGNKKLYTANVLHPLFRDIHNLILKESGIDRVIEKVIHRMGMLEQVILTGDFARGKDSRLIELILIGSNIDREYLSRKVVQAEELSGRKVSYVVLDPCEAEGYLKGIKHADLFPLWNSDEHTIPSPLRAAAGE
jgi:hypothetical protein